MRTGRRQISFLLLVCLFGLGFTSPILQAQETLSLYEALYKPGIRYAR